MTKKQRRLSPVKEEDSLSRFLIPLFLTLSLSLSLLWSDASREEKTISFMQKTTTTTTVFHEQKDRSVSSSVYPWEWKEETSIQELSEGRGNGWIESCKDSGKSVYSLWYNFTGEEEEQRTAYRVYSFDRNRGKETEGAINNQLKREVDLRVYLSL